MSPLEFADCPVPPFHRHAAPAASDSLPFSDGFLRICGEVVIPFGYSGALDWHG